MTQHTPQEGIAEALGDLSQQTRLLAREEINAAEQEMWEKVKAAAPAFGLAAVTGVCAVMAGASAYCFSLRLLEKRFTTPIAAFAATLGYGAITGGVGLAAVRGLRNVPPLLPIKTARDVGALASETVAYSGR